MGGSAWKKVSNVVLYVHIFEAIYLLMDGMACHGISSRITYLTTIYDLYTFQALL